MADEQHVLTTAAVTTLPVACFAIIGATAPRLSHRYGEHLLLVGQSLQGLLPLSLTMFGLRTRAARATAALAAFAQGIGYLVAGSGPLLVGLTVGTSRDWTGMFVLLFVALAVCLIAGLRASRPRYVDDEVAVSTR